MYYFFSHSNLPAFNLACEEYLLKNFEDDFFMLYINKPSLIVGKHQNTLAEINIQQVRDNNIPVVRRLSGGGTVFHDFGNLNYCFIKKGEKGKLVNFKKYSSPIINALQKLGVDAKFEGKSDLTIHGKKFSGNASHVYKNKIMQHGTMLFSSDLKRLNQLLKVNPLKFTDRGIRSIRSKVTNISEYLATPLEISQLADLIIAEIEKEYPNSHKYVLQEKDFLPIEQLIEEKYDNWDWNYAYSPNYNFNRTCNYPSGNILEISMTIKKGKIAKLEIFGNCLRTTHTDAFISLLVNQNHSVNSINQILDSTDLNLYFLNMSKSELLELFF